MWGALMASRELVCALTGLTTQVDNTSRQTSASGSVANPNGCWDWIGWYGGNFAQKAGTQMAAIKSMVDRVSAGSGGGGTLPAPTGVATSNATDTTMTIAWNAVSGATSWTRRLCCGM